MNPRPAVLRRITSEANTVLAFTFRYSQLQSRPGQFVMLWLPGVDQKPFSIAADDGKSFTVAVFKIKDFTAAMFKLKVGDTIGVTGPFGHPYTWRSRHHMIAVGGGYGAAPLAYLIREAKKEHCSYELLLGARRKNLLLYPTAFPEQTFIATNDGSLGHPGYITEVLRQRLERLTRAQRQQTTVYVCGPELMELAAAKLAQRYRVASQISVERYIKCGFGICGQCCIDDSGEPMCQAGPVITGQHALRLLEFGKYHRDKTGAMIHYD